MITGNKPFEYQSEILKDDSKRIAVRAGRQIGKSESIAVKALHYALLHKNQLILILAPTLRQSSIIFGKIDTFININPSLFKYVVRKSASVIRFDNGSEIYCLPSGDTGDTIRGFSPDVVIIDEAAFVPGKVFAAIEPSLAAKDGRLFLISTPFGDTGKFYEAFNPDTTFNTYHIPSNKCPLISEEFLNEQKERRTEMEYLQEYEGEFISAADTFFHRELVLSCIDEKT